MATITPEQLQKLSIKTVEGFLNDKVPLSIGLAKEASALELNPEQIRRGVEAVNNITYLKILQVSPDRTVEFPLCKYAEVISELGIQDFPSAYLQDNVEAEALVEKVAQAEPAKPSLEGVPEFRIQGRLLKEATIIRRDIEELEVKATHLRDDIVSTLSAICQDESGMDKLASVCTSHEFAPLSVLLTGRVAIPTNMPKGFFKEASLKTVNSLRELYQDARALSTQLNEKKASLERIENLVKQAFVGTTANLVGRGVGKAVGGTVKTPFRIASKSIGKVYDKVAAPIKATQADRMALRPSKTGKSLVKATDTLKITGKVAGKVGTAVSTASTPLLYTPSINKTTGAPIDVRHRVKTY